MEGVALTRADARGNESGAISITETFGGAGGARVDGRSQRSRRVGCARRVRAHAGPCYIEDRHRARFAEHRDQQRPPVWDRPANVCAMKRSEPADALLADRLEGHSRVSGT
jgi:hypothetical protein